MIVESTQSGLPMTGFALRIKAVSDVIKGETPSSSVVSCEDIPGNFCDRNSPFILQAFASSTSTDPLQNDYFSVLYEIPFYGVSGKVSLATVNFFLQQYTSLWSTVATLNDNTYGTLYPFDTFTSNPGFVGFKLNWKSVLSGLGDGFFRIRAAGTDVNGDAWEECHPIHCLQEYSTEAVSQTVRFEWYDNGIVSFETGTNFSLIDYKNVNWQEMIRLKGGFGYPEDLDEVTEFSRAKSNYYETARVKHEKTYKYKFRSGLYPDWVHSKLKDVAFVSNSLTVTDYRKLRKHNFERFPIIKEPDGYTPTYGSEYQKCYKAEVNFKNKKEDLGLRQCKVVTSGNCANVTIKNSSGEIIGSVPSGGIWVDGG